MKKKYLLGVLFTLFSLSLSSCAAGSFQPSNGWSNQTPVDTTYENYFELNLNYNYEIQRATNNKIVTKRIVHLYGKNNYPQWLVNCSLTNSYIFNHTPSFDVSELYSPLFNKLHDDFLSYDEEGLNPNLQINENNQDLVFDVSLTNPFNHEASVAVVVTYFSLFINVKQDRNQIGRFSLSIPCLYSFYLMDGDYICDSNGENVTNYETFKIGMVVEGENQNVYKQKINN